MKLFSLLFVAIVGTAVLTPATADARPHCGSGERTRVTYDRCGNPTFWVYTYAGRDCHGRPLYRWVVQSRGHRGGYDRGHGHHSHGGYDHGYSRGRTGISFHWSR